MCGEFSFLRPVSLFSIFVPRLFEEEEEESYST